MIPELGYGATVAALALAVWGAVTAAGAARTGRADLLRFVENGIAEDHKAEPFEAHRLAKERAWRLVRAIVTESPSCYLLVA